MERLEQLSDKCVIDVGINNGNDTIMYLTQGYYVYGIDADPDMVHLAKNRIPAIYKDRYNITNIGISDKCETIDFYINHFSGFNSFDKILGAKHANWNTNKPVGLKHTISVECITLDKFITEYVLPRYRHNIEYIKIDVEGYSYKSLIGLTFHKPKYISVEFDHANILQNLFQLGYKFFAFIDQAKLVNTDINISTINNKFIKFSRKSEKLF